MAAIPFNRNTSGVSQSGKRTALVKQTGASLAADTITRQSTGVRPTEVWQRLDGGNGVTIDAAGTITVTGARAAGAELLVVGD